MNEAQAEHCYALLYGRIDELEWLGGRHARDDDFRNWRAEVGLILRKTFGNESIEHAGFMRISFEPVTPLDGRSDAFQTGVAEAKVYLNTIMTQLGWFEGNSDRRADVTTRSPVPVDRLSQILDRFYAVVLALGMRGRERAPVTVADEYDVQYVLRALLAVRFPDVRPGRSADPVLNEFTTDCCAASGKPRLVRAAPEAWESSARTRPALTPSG